MKILWEYVKDHWKAVAAGLAALGTAALVFYLYGLPPEAPLYAGALAGVVILACLAVPDFISYARRVKTLEALRESLPTLPDVPEAGGPLPERELIECVRSLQNRLREMETANARKQRETLDYYTLWAHQIKTPLSAMRLILQADPGDAGDALLQGLFKVERYVEMVLGYLRLDDMNADLRLESCRVYDVVKQAVRKFAPQFIYQRLSLDLREFGNVVVTDEKWLLFVLEQLLSNALKYTKEGGVSIFMDEDDVLTILDTGTGIDAEDLPRIFERGFTGRNGRRDKSATGLGLYLVKRAADKLQNRVEILSEPGAGARVRLYLKREDAAVYR